MEPQTNPSTGQADLQTTGGTDTFTEQVAAEKTVSEDTFTQNQVATNQHNRRVLSYVIWGVLLFLLLAAVGTGSYILWRNRQGLAQDLGIAGLFNPTNINLKGSNETITVGGGQGLLTVNGSALITGDLTVNGTVTAGAFQGDGSGLTNLQSTLPPFVAFTNKNSQLFFGNNQLFRNTADSTTALQVQQASGNPVFAVDTANNKGKFYNGLEVGNIANLQSSIFNDPFFGIGGNIYKNLAVASELTNNQPGVTYTGMGNEFLINPQNDPVSGGNLFAASYSAAKIAEGNSNNYITVAGSLTNLTHAGSGTVKQAVGQIGIVSNTGSGTIDVAANGVYTTTVSGSGNVLASFGVLSLNPSILPTASGQIGISAGLVAGNCGAFTALSPPCVGVTASPKVGNQIGLLVFNQDASLGSNINVLSQGPSSVNYFEGTVGVGVCSSSIVSVIGGCSLGFSTGTGPKLLVNAPTGGITTAPLDTVTQLYSNRATDKALIVRGFTGQTANLTEWQDSAGTALTVVDRSGNIAVGSGSVVAGTKFTVTSTNDTPAAFVGNTKTCTVDTFGGGWSCVSDARLKKNIMSINGGLDKILELRGVTYDWKSDPNATQAVSGFIAQEVQKVLPGLVSTMNDGTLSLNKDGMLPYLVEAVKTENGKIDQINTKLADQGIKVDSLSDEFKKLSDQVANHEDRLKSLETKSAAQEKRIEQLEGKITPVPATTPTTAP